MKDTFEYMQGDRFEDGFYGNVDDMPEEKPVYWGYRKKKTDRIDDKSVKKQPTNLR